MIPGRRRTLNGGIYQHCLHCGAEPFENLSLPVPGNHPCNEKIWPTRDRVHVYIMCVFTRVFTALHLPESHFPASCFLDKKMTTGSTKQQVRETCWAWIRGAREGGRTNPDGDSSSHRVNLPPWRAVWGRPVWGRTTPPHPSPTDSRLCADPVKFPWKNGYFRAPVPSAPGDVL